MLPIQPTGLHHYLKLKSNRFPKDLKQYFYMSWEDALWDLLKNLEIRTAETVLVPEFFCGDVIENMAAHGLRAVFYPVDRNFQTNPAEFKKMLELHQPSIVIILHAVGITNTLLAHSELWLKALPKQSLLIEDSVHRVVNPEKLTLLSDRHVVIDSLRKVVPLAGSRLLTHASLQLKQTSWYSTIWYQIRVIWWWLVFQFFLALHQNIQAEKFMLRGYDAIGDSHQAGRGWDIFNLLAEHLDYEKIQQSKSEQVKLYQQLLKPVWKSRNVFSIQFPDSDSGELRGFPIGIEVEKASKILEKLRQNGLLHRFELNDSPWASHQKVIYLPLGPHLSLDQVKQASHILLDQVL